MAGEPYGRVVRSFWSDPDVKSLPRELKELLLYFATSPHGNMIGVYHCPLLYAAAESGTPIDEVRAAVDGPLAKFLTYDEATEEVFVHAGAKHCSGDELKKGDNRIKNVEKLVEAVHSPRLRRLFLERYAKLFNLSQPLRRTIHLRNKGSSKPLTSPSGARAVAVAVAGAETKQILPASAGPHGDHDENGGDPLGQRGGWPAEWARIFSKYIGELEPGRIGKRCAVVRRKYGEERSLEMWDVYCHQRRHFRFGRFEPEHDDPKAATPEDFAQTAKQWFDLTEPIAHATA